MVSSRTVTALAGIFASLLLSVVLWWQFDTLAFFLFVPFVPFLFRRLGSSGGESAERVRRCRTCGFQTTNDAYEYCPRDGTRLESRDGRRREEA